jgi:hypothetical protein
VTEYGGSPEYYQALLKEVEDKISAFPYNPSHLFVKGTILLGLGNRDRALLSFEDFIAATDSPSRIIRRARGERRIQAHIDLAMILISRHVDDPPATEGEISRRLVYIEDLERTIFKRPQNRLRRELGLPEVSKDEDRL